MLKKFNFRPGVNRENTRYTTEGGWYETDKVRFRQGTPEKIGGWQRISNNTFLGTCRSLFVWSTLVGRKLIGTLTNRFSYITYNGEYNNVSALTPLFQSGFNYSKTAGSSVIRIFIYPYPNSVNYDWIGSYFYFVDSPGLDANITASVLNNNYFTIVGFSYLNYVDVEINVTAATTVTNQPWPGGYVRYLEPLYSGYYSQSNFGQDLVFCQRGGHLCVWNGAYGFLLNGNTCTITVGATTTVTTTQVCPPNTQRFPVQFASSGTLPTGLDVLTWYYLQPTVTGSTTTFTVYAAATGTALVATSGSYTGTIYIRISATTIAGVSDPSPAAVSDDIPDKVNVTLVSDISSIVFAFGTNELGTTDSIGTSTIQPMLVRWSDVQDYTNWTPSATSQAGFLYLSRGSEIITAIQSRQEILVWTDAALYSLQYLQVDPWWGAQLVGDNISIVSQNAVAYANGVSYWMGRDKFYKYDGRTQTLNCDLRQYIFSDINAAQYDQVTAGTNEGFNEIWWFYCSASSSVIDRYVIYNYAENIWYYGTNMERTAWADSGLLEYPIAAAAFTYNLVYHEYGVDNNQSGLTTPIIAEITSAQFDVDDGDKFMFIRRVVPDLTFRGSTATNPKGYLTLQPLKNSGSGVTDPASVGSGTGPSGTAIASITRTATVPIEEFTGQVYFRVRARQMSIRFSSDEAGVTWQLGSMRFDMREDGSASGSGVSGG